MEATHFFVGETAKNEENCLAFYLICTTFAAIFIESYGIKISYL
jgi:hypothetical protein